MADVRQRGLSFLIVTGHPYDAAYSRWLRERLPQATVTVFPNSGHFPHLVDPDAFAALLAGTARWQPEPGRQPHGRHAAVATEPGRAGDS